MAPHALEGETGGRGNTELPLGAVRPRVVAVSSRRRGPPGRVLRSMYLRGFADFTFSAL